MNQNTVYEPADLIIYVRGRGIVLREKSLVAYRGDDGKIVAFGSEAERMIGKDAENLVIMSPLRQGRVADYCVATMLFSMLLVKALGKKPLLKPAVVVCVPRGSTEVEKKALEEALIYGKCVKELLFTELSVGEVIDGFEEKDFNLYRKYSVIIGIGKNEPERYIEQWLREILAYGAQEGIGPERVSAMMRGLLREQDETTERTHEGRKEKQGEELT